MRNFRQWTLLTLGAFMVLTGVSMQPAEAVTLYSVRPKDTLSKIAKSHGVSVEAIRRANSDMREEKVRVGQILIIPDPEQNFTPAPTSSTIVIHGPAVKNGRDLATVIVPPTRKQPVPVVKTTTAAAPVVAPVIPPVRTESPVRTETVRVDPPVRTVVTAREVSRVETPIRAETTPGREVVVEGPRPSDPSLEPEVRTEVVRLTETRIPPHENIAIIDNRIIRVPTYVPPAPTMTEDNDTPNRGRLASRKGSLIHNIIKNARRYMGVPYVWGGTTSSGFDCSGFVMRIFAMNGVKLLRTADSQYYQGKPVKNPEPGDLVFFSTYLPGPSHVGIYLGGNYFIHASSRKGVCISSLKDEYFSRTYIGSRRYF